MKNIRFIIPKNKKDINCVGFDVNNSTFIFPCQYFNADEKITKQEYKLNEDKNIVQHLKFEAKKLTDIIAKIKYQFYYGEGVNNLEYLSMKWLIEDFLTNGYYKEKKKEISNESLGKIDWKSTLKNKDVWISGSNIVFKNMYRIKYKYQDNETITHIYKACLKYAVDNFGWMFGINYVEDSYFNVNNNVQREFMIRYLKEKLNTSFQDYKKILFNNLLKILNSCAGEEVNNFIMASDYEFEYVFERLVDKCFASNSAKEFYKNCVYNLFNRGKVNASKLRPDTIMINNKICYVIDAKYYDYGYQEKHIGSRDLPQSSSITKQIIYMKYIQSMTKSRNNCLGNYNIVKSAFLLPYGSKGNEKMKKIGHALMDKEEKDVGVFLVDLKSLVDRYYLKSNNEDLKDEFIILEKR